MRELLLRGVRYRFANGLRQAMRLWGTLIVVSVVAVGLNAQPATEIWIHAWRASRHSMLIAVALSFAIAVAVRPILVRALRGHGQRDFLLLPLTPAQRFAIDGSATIVFMLVPFATLLAAGVAAGAFVATLLGIIAALALLTLTLGAQESRPKSEERGPSLIGVPHEVRWLLRGRGVAGSTAAAAIAIVGAWAAIRNNDVVSPLAIARINGVFGAVAALIVATAIVRTRTSMRPFRVAEATLPVSSEARMRAMCSAAIIFAVPLFAAGFAAPFAFLTLLAIVLLGEHFSLRAVKREWQLNVIGAWAAIIAAFDARVATLGALILLPYAWSRAVASDRTSDLPIAAEED